MSETLYKIQTIDVFCDDSLLPHHALMFTSQDRCEVVLFRNDRYGYHERKIHDSTYNRTSIYLDRTVSQFICPYGSFVINDKEDYKITSGNRILKKSPKRSTQQDIQHIKTLPTIKPQHIDTHLAHTLIFDGNLYDWYGRRINTEKSIKRVITYFDTSMYRLDPDSPQRTFSYEYYIVELVNGDLSLAYLDYDKATAEKLFDFEHGYAFTIKTAILCKPKLKKINNFLFKDFVDFTTSDKPVLQKIVKPISWCGPSNGYFHLEEKSPRFALLGTTNGKTKEESLLVYGMHDIIEDSPKNLLPDPIKFSVNLDNFREYYGYGYHIGCLSLPPDVVHLKSKPTFSDDGETMAIYCAIDKNFLKKSYEYNCILREIEKTEKIRLSISCKDIPEEKILYGHSYPYDPHPWYYDPKP